MSLEITFLCLVVFAGGLIVGVNIPRMRANKKFMEILRRFVLIAVLIFFVTLCLFIGNSFGLIGALGACFICMLVGARLSIGKPKRFFVPREGVRVCVEAVTSSGFAVVTYSGKTRLFMRSYQESMLEPTKYQFEVGEYQVITSRASFHDSWSTFTTKLLKKIG
jgi:hypothetical protein